MSTKVSTETHIEVWDEGIGACIKVGPGRDVPGMIDVTAPAEHFGACDLTLSHELALALADALVKAVRNNTETDR